MKAILRSINNFSCKLKQSNNLKYNISPKIRSNKFKSISGNGNIVIEDALNKNLNDYKIYGNTYQNSTRGVNLFNHYLYPANTTYNGITITNNGDGSFTLNGTCTTNNSSFALGSDTKIKELANEGQVTQTAYYISGTCTKGSSSYARTTIRLNYDTGYTRMIPLQNLSTQGIISKTHPQDSRETGWSWRIVLDAGDTFDNFTIKYQLEKGSEATEYEPYTNGPAPNPEFPIDMVSCGENKTGLPLGYTQVDYIESSGTQYIDTGIIPSQLIHIIDTMSAEGRNQLNQAEVGVPNRFKWGTDGASKIYVGYGENHGSDVIAYLNNFYTYDLSYGSQKVKDSLGNIVIEANDSSIQQWLTYSLCLFARRNADGTVTGTSMRRKHCLIYDSDVLVRNFIPCYRNSDNEVGLYDLVNNVFYTNQGSGVFTYGSEIEQGGYKIPVNVRSKNLYYGTSNQYSIISGQNTWYFINGSPGAFGVNIGTKTNYKAKIEKNKTYCMKALTTDNVYFQLVYSDETIITSSSGTKNISSSRINEGVYFTSDRDDFVILRVSLRAGESISISNIQLEEGVSATSYQPYYNETTNIYLDEPLRKIDEYSDYIDFKNGKVVRNIDSIVFSGDVSENWSLPNTSPNTLRFTFSNGLPNGKDINIVKIISNKFVNGSRTLDNGDYEHIRSSAIGYPRLVSLNINKNRLTENTVNAFKTWLSNNPITVDYVLETPTEEDIELPNINLIEGKNIITIGTEVYGVFEVEYYSKEIIDISNYKYNLRKVED